jgi:hypothetical protein
MTEQSAGKESRRSKLIKRAAKQTLRFHDAKGYFVYQAGSSTNEGVLCSNLDAVERHLKKVEAENEN